LSKYTKFSDSVSHDNKLFFHQTHHVLHTTEVIVIVQGQAKFKEAMNKIKLNWSDLKSREKASFKKLV